MCHLCHGSCKSWKRGTRPPSSRYKTGRNILGKMKAMYERPRGKVKVERSSTLTCTRALRNIVSILFKRVKSYVCTDVKITRQWKSTLREFNNGTILFTKKRYICCSTCVQESMILIHVASYLVSRFASIQFRFFCHHSDNT